MQRYYSSDVSQAPVPRKVISASYAHTLVEGFARVLVSVWREESLVLVARELEATSSAHVASQAQILAGGTDAHETGL